MLSQIYSSQKKNIGCFFPNIFNKTMSLVCFLPQKLLWRTERLGVQSIKAKQTLTKVVSEHNDNLFCLSLMISGPAADLFALDDSTD